MVIRQIKRNYRVNVPKTRFNAHHGKNIQQKIYRIKKNLPSILFEQNFSK